MKRLNKFLKIAILGLLSLVAVDGAAQKTVTYTFKGSILSGLSDSGTLYLKSSGKKPAGVPDPTKADIHNYEKHLLGGLSTLYTIQENEYAWIDFTNFKYEVEEVKWRRRSQWNLVTSKGGSWITTFDGKDVGYTAYEPENGAEDAEAGDIPFSTSGELLYHDRTFATRTEVSPGVWQNFAGLKKLNVQVTSTQVYKGIAVKEFEIKYYEPEPKIEVVEEIRDGSDNLTGYKIKITIGKEQHVGAFTADDFLLDYDDTKLDVTPFGAPHMEGSTIRADYQLDIKSGATGTTVVSAIITNGADNIIAGKSQQPLKLQISDKAGFYVVDSNHWRVARGIGSNNQTSRTWGSDLAGAQISYSPTDDVQIKTATLNSMQSSSDNSWRARAVRLSYDLEIPAYTNVICNFNFNPAAETTTGGINTYSTAEIIDLGTNINSVTNYQFNQSTSSATSGGFAHARGNCNTEDDDPQNHSWYYTNKDSSIPKSGDNKETHYFALLSQIIASTGGFTAAYTYTYGNPSSGKAFTYDYYGYPQFFLDEDAASYSYQQTIHKEVTSDLDLTKGGLPEDDLSTTATDNLKTVEELGISKPGYTFLYWVDKNDNDRIYYDGDPFCPYDALNGSGKGYHKLVGVWAKNSETTMIVTFYAEGGEIPASTIAKAEYMHQVQVNAGHTDWAASLPTSFKPTKVGCTFDGYYDQDGVKVFNADLTTIKTDSKYFNTDGSWKATDDVDFYAHFSDNSSSEPERWTISFNANGGSTSLSSATVVKGGKVNNNVGTNPDTHESWIPTRDGYVFTGWYTAISGGVMVYDDSGVAIKLKAVYEENLSAVPPTPAWAEYEAYDNTRWSNDGKWIVSGTGTLQLYAQWKESSLTFDEKDGGLSGTGHPTTYSDKEEMPKVIMKRTFVADKWNTICFPFALNQTQATYLFSKIMEYDDLEIDTDSKANMKFKEVYSIEAGKPYFVKKNADSENTSRPAYFTAEGLIAKDVILETTAGSISKTRDDVTVTMIGNFEVYTHIKEGDLYLQNDKFYVSGGTYKVGGEDKIVWGNNRGYRCTFRVEDASGAKSLSLHLDLEGYDGWTGEDAIEDINAEGVYSAGGGDIYDLSGRQLVGKPQRGLYIVNGRKYIAK